MEIVYCDTENFLRFIRLWHCLLSSYIIQRFVGSSGIFWIVHQRFSKMVQLVVQDSWGFFGIDKCWSSLASFLRNRIYVAAITLNLTEMLLRWMETPNGLLKSKEDFSELLTFIRLNHQYHSGGKIELAGMTKEYTQFHNKASWISTAIWIKTERLFHKQSTCSNGLLQTGVYSHLPVEKSTRSTQPQSQKVDLSIIWYLVHLIHH